MHNSILKKDTFIKFSMQVNSTLVCTVNKSQSDIIIHFKMTSLKPNFSAFCRSSQNNTHMTKLFMNLKYYYSGNEINKSSFIKSNFKRTRFPSLLNIIHYVKTHKKNFIKIYKTYLKYNKN